MFSLKNSKPPVSSGADQTAFSNSIGESWISLGVGVTVGLGISVDVGIIVNVRVGVAFSVDIRVMVEVNVAVGVAIAHPDKSNTTTKMIRNLILFISSSLLLIFIRNTKVLFQSNIYIIE